MRLSATKAKSTNQYRGLGDQLYDLGGARPTLDLNFANNGSLVDSITGKNLVTHTRASSATYVDGDGLIKNAVTNLFEDSEGFNASSAWSVSSLRGTATDNASTAPDGTLTATLLVEDTQSAGRLVTNGHNFVANQTYTISCWAKQYTSNRYLGLVFSSTSFGVQQAAIFDITGNGSSTVTAGSGTASIEAFPNGWYRCSLTATAATTQSSSTRLQLSNSSSDATPFYTGDGVSGIYVWGAQLEESSTAGEYIKTTGTVNSAPRFDHDPVTGESLGLLIEEPRTNLLPHSKLNGSYVLSMLTRTLTTEINPAGESATRHFQAVSGSGLHRSSFNSFSTNSVTVSAFVKKDTHRYVNIGYGGLQNSFSALFDIEPGLTSDRLLGQGVKGSSSTNISAGYQDFSNGWVRIWATGTTTGGNGFSLQLAEDATSFSISSWNAAGTEAIYAWGAQLEDDAEFPTSLIPTAGVTATRAADITSITNNDFGTFNLLQYSEQFDQADWTNSGSLITPNREVAPDGTLTADMLSTGSTNLYQTFTNNITTYTASVFVKSAGADSVQLGLFGGLAGLNANSTFSFATNTISSTGTVDSVSSQPYGSGWYRIIITATATGTATPQVRLFSINGDTYIWGAQLEESSTVTPYVKSDVTFTSRASTATYYDYNGVIQTAAVDEARNVAFLPDSNGNFVSAGEFLLEEARTNLVPYSVANISNGWARIGSTLSVDLSLNELGVFTGVRSISDGASWHGVANGHTLTAGTTYNVSVWYKKGDVNPTGKIRILHKKTGIIGACQIARNNLDPMDISDHLVNNVSTHGTISNITVKNLSNGVYKISYNFASAATGSYQLTISPNTQVVGESVIVLGAQVEEGSYPTSYIPTNGATATRAADVSSSSANTFGNSFYKQGEGTLFADSVSPPSIESTLYRLVGLTNGTSSNATGNRVLLYRQGSLSRAYLRISDGAVTQAAQSEPNWPISTRLRIVVGFKENSMNASFGGSVKTEDTSGTIPVMDRLIIGSNESGSVNLHWNSTISRITYWPTRLSNTTLQTITN